ncbi:AAA family ATPase [Glaesserella sp.]
MRQVWKSTMLQYISDNYQYITFDESIILSMDRNDSTSFMLNQSGKLILNEVQYVPELFSSLKLAINKQKKTLAV